MFTHRKFLVAFALICAPGAGAYSQELVHQFINPNFGGNPGNASFLFSLAETQAGATIELYNNSAGAGGGAASPGVGGGIGGPTIVIPITTGDPGTPTENPENTEAVVEQIN